MRLRCEPGRCLESLAMSSLPSYAQDLGDGIFDMPRWQGHGGAWGVGSDSHACVNAAEELLMLEYSQRLSLRQRNG